MQMEYNAVVGGITKYHFFFDVRNIHAKKIFLKLYIFYGQFDIF